jgi:hypothetical protein
MASPIFPSPKDSAPALANEHIVSAFFVFSIVESVPAATYLWSVPSNGWFILLCVALPAGLGGATAWAMVCGRLAQVRWSQAARAGAVGGVLSPLYLFAGLCVVALLYPGEETSSEAILGLIAGLLYLFPLVGLLAAYMTLMGLVAGLINWAMGNCSADGIKTSSGKGFFTSHALRMWMAQFATAFLVFMIPGFVTAVMLFSPWQTSFATLAAGLSGATAWILVCGRLRQLAWWRAVLGGALAGILVHPCFWFLASLSSRSFRPEDSMPYPHDLGIYTNALGSFGNLGLFTVPAAIVAGLTYRAWADYRGLN